MLRRMTLTTRVCAFFLGILALCFGVYSIIFYGIAAHHIRYEFDHELHSALSSLAAAVEVEETEAKWQPLEHAISLGPHQAVDNIAWLVLGDNNQIVEQSTNSISDLYETAKRLSASQPLPSHVFSLREPHNHRDYIYERLRAPKPERDDRQPDEFDELLIIVSRSTIPRNQVLYQLALLVTFVPLIVLAIVAMLARWVVQKALRPVHDMAYQAQSIQGGDFNQRLNLPPYNDELTNLGYAFNQLLDRQQLAFDQQRRFAGDAAHELRTPLTVLLGHIDVTLRRQRSTEEYTSNLQILRNQTIDLQRIVESLLFLARANNDAIPPQLEDISLHHWLTNYWQGRADTTRRSDLHLDNQIPASTMIRATSPLLSRIVDNLVSNAIKYTPPGSKITLTGRVENQSAVISVIDEGPGIPDTDLPHIFEPFFRSHTSNIPGTGLGLAIAQRITHVLGGTLTVANNTLKGSTFTLELPAK